LHKSQLKDMKKQDNCFPSKAKSTTKDLNNSKEKDISNFEFQNIIEIVIKNLKSRDTKASV
jgi:hypothetical protein